ncbi:MAG TPA: glycosyltransferase family 9 protein [Chloroflexota bacterium]|nr:glycosyltransferase family 9 protein [Chloroflexota bacterium]
MGFCAPSAAPTTLLVYRPGALGDFLLALPALAALRAAYPAAHLAVIGPAPALPLARASGLADAVLASDDPRLTALFASTPPAEPPAGLPRPDAAVLWAGARAAPLAAALRAWSAAVVHAPGRPPPACRQPVAAYLCATLAPLGVPAAPVPVVRVRPAAQAAAEAAAFLAAHGSPEASWIALHVGSGSPRKNWPLARWQALAAALHAAGARLLLLAGPAEAAQLPDAWAALGSLRPVLVQDWSLDQLAALLAHCVGYLGADSGVTHLAAAVGTPVVALFGPTDPALWAPRGPRVAVIRQPCACPREPGALLAACDCLAALAPRAVLIAARALGGPFGQLAAAALAARTPGCGPV